MKYKNTNEIAKLWHMSTRTIRNFCSQNKIPGAIFSGKQWLIPIDAKPPIDGRTKEAKVNPGNYHYKFPVFIYSPYYNNVEELNEKEQLLLKAQKLHLEGRYYDSIAICRSMLSNVMPTYLTAGVYCTIGFDALLLGMYSECHSAIIMLKRLIEVEPIHKEDIILMTASLRYHVEWDYSKLIEVNPSMLSPDAIPFYQYNIMFINILTGSVSSRSVFRYFQADCISLKQLCIMPALFALHCMLGVENITEKSAAEKEYHIRYAVQMAIENNWIAHLAKFCNYESMLIEKCLAEYGNNYVSILKEKRQINTKNWSIINNYKSGCDYSSLFSCEQVEVLLLISYGFSNKKIATIKGCNLLQIKTDIQHLCTIAGVNKKDELKAYAKNAFGR